MKEIILDIETTGLEVTSSIHCIGAKLIIDSDSSPAVCYTSRPIKHSNGNFTTCLETIASTDKVITFNGVSFDIPVIEKFFDLTFNAPEHLDLMILAKIMFTKDQLIAIDAGIPIIDKKDWGKFSLDAFSKRIGTELKGSHSDWSQLSEEMVVYCKQDIDSTEALYNSLVSMDNYPPQNVIELEHKVADLIAQQERAGFYFNIDAARKLYTEMMFEKGNIERSLLKTFKPMYLPEGPVQSTNKLIKRKLYIDNLNYTNLINSIAPYKRPLKRYKSGKLKQVAKTAYKWFDSPKSTIIQEKNGEFQNIKLTKFTATDNQIKVWLKRMYDFEFTTYTAKGGVKVDRDDLLKLGKNGENLRRLIKLKKDLSQLGGTDNSLIAKFNPDTHSIHGRVDTIGAATHRMTHSGPNLAQIPATADFRSLFTVPPGWILVGADLANIEIRVLAHYLAEFGNQEYTKAVLSKDMHWYHAKLAGFWTIDDRDWPDDAHDHLRTPEMKAARASSKGFFFGYLYGQGDTIRGYTLWTPAIEAALTYTEEEYSKASKRIDKRLNGEGLFPLKKDLFVQPTETLILQTIYGKQVADSFLRNLTGIDKLIEHCQNQSKSKGTVTAIDSRELYSRSPHSALNLLLQGSAGVIGKQWMVNYHQLAQDSGLYPKLDYNQYAYIHDEFQCGCDATKAHILCNALEEGAAQITEQFNMNIPIKADATTGPDWSHTH